jgi:hypothetical protein
MTSENNNSSESEYKQKTSKYSNIPSLDLEINDFADQKWFNPKFIQSSKKIKYQVKNAPNAHWGIHNALIVGACPVPAKTEQYPFSNAKFLETHTRRDLEILIKEHGVTAFMSLMDECDENGNEKSKFRPYSKLDLPVIDPNVKFFKLPIKDCKTTDDSSLLEFAKLAVQLLQSGDKIYLHCWGGHGRAGTVYCLILQLVYNMTANDALDYCQRIHDCRKSYITVGSPQTLEQATQVRRLEEIIQAQAEEDARARAEEDARTRAEEDARTRAEEDARAQAEEDARARAEETSIEIYIETEQVDYREYNQQDYDYVEDFKYNKNYDQSEYYDYYDDKYDDGYDDGYDKYDDIADTLEDTISIPNSSSVSISPYSNKAVRAKVKMYNNNY